MKINLELFASVIPFRKHTKALSDYSYQKVTNNFTKGRKRSLNNLATVYFCKFLRSWVVINFVNVAWFFIFSKISQEIYYELQIVINLQLESNIALNISKTKMNWFIIFNIIVYSTVYFTYIWIFIVFQNNPLRSELKIAKRTWNQSSDANFWIGECIFWNLNRWGRLNISKISLNKIECMGRKFNVVFPNWEFLHSHNPWMFPGHTFCAYGFLLNEFFFP